MTRRQGTVYECDGCGKRVWSEVLPKGWWQRADGEAHLCEGCELGWQMAQKAKGVKRDDR
jgi:hypothetical protein